MRLQSQVWVSAYIRQVELAGASAMLVKRGEATAGAIYIKVSCLDKTSLLYCPALIISETKPDERSWRSEFGSDPVDEGSVDEFLASQISFDADIWVVEVEDPQGRHFLGDQLQDD